MYRLNLTPDQYHTNHITELLSSHIYPPIIPSIFQRYPKYPRIDILLSPKYGTPSSIPKKVFKKTPSPHPQPPKDPANPTPPS